MMYPNSICKITKRPTNTYISKTVPIIVGPGSGLERGDVFLKRSDQTGIVTIELFSRPPLNKVSNVYFFEREIVNPGDDPHLFVIDVAVNPKLVEVNTNNLELTDFTSELIGSMANVFLHKVIMEKQLTDKFITHYNSTVSVSIDKFNEIFAVRLMPWGNYYPNMGS